MNVLTFPKTKFSSLDCLLLRTGIKIMKKNSQTGVIEPRFSQVGIFALILITVLLVLAFWLGHLTATDNETDRKLEKIDNTVKEIKEKVK